MGLFNLLTYYSVIKWASFYTNKVYNSESTSWEDVTDGILCVTVYHEGGIHRLIGGDYYWIKGDAYGMVYDGTCCEAGEVWWQHGERQEKGRPKGVTLKSGLMLPDKEWEKFMEELNVT